MSITKKVFGTDKKSKKAIYEYHIRNKNGMCAKILNYGGIIRELWVPDKDGKRADVVLGHDDLMPYYENPGYLGAAVGPNANRIGGAKFMIDGVEYRIPANENGNNLHSDNEDGYHVRVFDVEEGENNIKLYLKDEDGNMGFPGNKKLEITYTVTEENELRLDYHFTSDRRTLLNPTNHSYFNLNGHDSGSILSHRVVVDADAFTLTDDESIPTGEIMDVTGTPMDFRNGRVIGDEIDSDFEAIRLGKGYDHNWVLKNDRKFAKVAETAADESGIVMDVYTDLPGIQVYTSNFLNQESGKDGAVYPYRAAVCFETQYFPDAVHKEHFEGPVVKAGETYDTTTVYRFYQMP